MAHQEQSNTTISLCALNFKKMSCFATIHHLGNKSLETPENKKDPSVLRSHHKNNLCRQTIPKRCKKVTHLKFWSVGADFVTRRL